ncbi:hypothetical protein D4R52_01890 [bacterium]|nr:MAG: hypothetical protein D4R52_01890 [bacterium]
MKKSIIPILIILLFVLAGIVFSSKNRSRAAGEWVDINLLTIPTKAKQEKMAEYANRHVANFIALSKGSGRDGQDAAYELAAYQARIFGAEDAAEKIIFLDGAEINLADKLESETRGQEQALGSALMSVPKNESAAILEALNSARIANSMVFKYMVKNYQLSDADIAKHKAVVSAHLNLVGGYLAQSKTQFTAARLDKIQTLISEAEDFRKAGLNWEAYQKIDEAKNIIYGQLLFEK